MKKMIIFEPAMCCSTGVCGPSIDPELLRISAILNNLKNNEILVERYNLTNNPQIFVDNTVINKMISEGGVDILPIIMVDGSVVKTKAYPTNKEFCELLDIPEDHLKINIKKTSRKCCCKGECC